MKLGLGTYTYAWAIGVPGQAAPDRPMGALDFLEEAIRLEVGVVQFCDNLPLTRLNDAELKALEARARAAGLAFELGTRGLDPTNLRSHLALARRLGCSFLRVVVDSGADQPTPEETVARLRLILPEFEQGGVKIALENHDRFRSRTLVGIIHQLGAERVGICLDTVNSFGALEGPEVVVETLAPFALCLHVKDFTIRRLDHQMGFVVEGCPAGQGRLDVPWLLEALRVSPHAFNAILETWVPPRPTLAETTACERRWTEAGVRHLQQAMGSRLNC